MASRCIHVAQVRPVEPLPPQGCAECRDTHHPIARSYEPGENTAWCYVDGLYLEPAPSRSVHDF